MMLINYLVLLHNYSLLKRHGLSVTGWRYEQLRKLPKTVISAGCSAEFSNINVERGKLDFAEFNNILRLHAVVLKVERRHIFGDQVMLF